MFLFWAISRPWFAERLRARAKLDEICYKIVPAGPVRGILQGGHQVFSTILMYTEKRGRGTILVAIESRSSPVVRSMPAKRSLPAIDRKCFDCKQTTPSTGSASVVKLHSWHPASPRGALFILSAFLLVLSGWNQNVSIVLLQLVRLQTLHSGSKCRYTPRKITTRSKVRKFGMGMVSKLWLHLVFLQSV